MAIGKEAGKRGRSKREGESERPRKLVSQKAFQRAVKAEYYQQREADAGNRGHERGKYQQLPAH